MGHGSHEHKAFLLHDPFIPFAATSIGKQKTRKALKMPKKLSLITNVIITNLP